MTACQEALVVQRREGPPDALHVLVRVRDVRVVVVQPVADPLTQPLPVVLVAPYALATEAVERLDSERLDELLPAASSDLLPAHASLLEQRRQLLLHLDLDRKPVRVPPGFPQHAVSTHRAMAAEEVLDRPGEDVVDARPSVRGRGSLEEHPRWGLGTRLERAREQVLITPAREDLLLQRVRAAVGRKETKSRLRSRPRHRRSNTPHTSAVRAGSARPATAMIFSTLAGSSASGRHWSVMIETPSTRMPP